MSKISLSDCFSPKQITILNDKFPQLPFELGCVLDEAFFKILNSIEVMQMDTEVLCFCDETGTNYLKHLTYDHEVSPPELSIMNTLQDGSPYEPVGVEKKAQVSIAKPTFTVSGKESVTGDDATAVLLNPPADVIGAVVQIITTCCVRVCWDGSSPTGTTGYQLGNGATVCLGCTPNESGDVTEVSKFQAIGEPGCTFEIVATYYK